MAIDLQRVITAAAQAALDDSGGKQQGRGGGKQQGRGGGERGRVLSAPRTFLIGAGLVTAARLVAAARGRNVLESLQQRLVEFEERHFDEGTGFDEDEEEPEGEYDEEEPEGEYDEEEPEGEYEDEYDEAGERSKGNGARR